jgi:glycosyltransferase involved in cell wall biosynthesis
VASEDEMADAIRNARTIDPVACREVARERFSLERMVRQYLAAYEGICRGSGGRQVSGAA